MVGVALIVIIGFGGYLWLRQLLAPVDPGDTTLIEVKIPLNTSARRVAEILKENNLITSPGFFVFLCRVEGYDAQLKAGIYQFRRSQGLMEIIEDLAEGRVATVRIVVPEGSDLKQIGGILIQQGLGSEADWEQALKKEYQCEFIKSIPESERRLEGFLYPDTYLVRKDASLEEVINIMLRRFTRVWNENFASAARSKGLTPYQVVTMASMVEKEALFDEERPRIAGVMYNRLRAGMPLQVDATVLYSLGCHKDKVTFKDLKVDSPYNTYLYTGLPPGPIASPGYESIKAVIYPEKHDYYYYVAMPDGHHWFSSSYEEHVAAKNRYQSK